MLLASLTHVLREEVAQGAPEGDASLHNAPITPVSGIGRQQTSVGVASGLLAGLQPQAQRPGLQGIGRCTRARCRLTNHTLAATAKPARPSRSTGRHHTPLSERRRAFQHAPHQLLEQAAHQLQILLPAQPVVAILGGWVGGWGLAVGRWGSVPVATRGAHKWVDE